MSISRRSLLLTAVALPAARAFAFVPDRPDPKAVAGAALLAAKQGGASYCDVRLVRLRREALATRDDHLTSAADHESYGVGVRVLKQGVWGFAGTPDVSAEGARRAAGRALLVAEANAALGGRPVQLAPEPGHQDSWQTPLERDPFRVPLAAKVALLVDAGRAAKGAQAAVKSVAGSLNAVLEEKRFFSSDGADLEQMLTRMDGNLRVTVVGPQGFEDRSLQPPASAGGFELIDRADFVGQAPRLAREALDKLGADKPPVGPQDLVLHPSHLWLVIHESIGHSTELDRALGFEANFAGTSFASPAGIGDLRYGSKLANFYADRTTPGGLATCAYDDEGVATTRFDLVREGVLQGFQTTRDQLGLPGFAGERSRGCSYAESWAAPQFQRMPNVSLSPGKAPLSLEQLIAGTAQGIYIEGRGSYSIDQQRKNFQFGGDLFWLIKDGKLDRPLRKVAYQSTTTDFWAGLDAVCDAREFRLNGAMQDGKGEPMQLNPVSHGCAPSRVRGVRVLDASEGAT